VAYARELAGDLGSILHVIHVVAPPWERQLTYIPPAAVVAGMERLTGAHTEGTDGPGRVVSTIRVGDAAPKITDYAESVNASLIVMATHGRSAFAQIVLGGVTQRLLADAKCPVLTLNGQVCRRMERVRLDANLRARLAMA
jgi:nucleotide-binding universal stress UspA family protein